MKAGEVASRCSTATKRGGGGAALSVTCTITRGFGRIESGSTVGATVDVMMNNANTAAMVPVAAATIRQRTIRVLSAITFGGSGGGGGGGGGNGISGRRGGAVCVVSGGVALVTSH